MEIHVLVDDSSHPFFPPKETQVAGEELNVHEEDVHFQEDFYVLAQSPPCSSYLLSSSLARRNVV